MKRMVFFITLAFLLSASLVLTPVQVFAQKQITVLNPSFEKPDSGKIQGFDGKTTHTGTGFKVLIVPGWHVDSPDSSAFDSGIEKKATSDGLYDAFLMGGDSAIYQILSRRVADGDMLKLTVDARNSWQATAMKMELFYLDNDTIAKANRVILVSETKTLTNTMTGFSISINASAVPLAVGHKIGILLDNVTPAPNDSACWLELDNVRLTNEDPTIIEVTNYSFEQPDSGKIKGWNGPGSGIGWTGNKTDVPGWTTDTMKVTDSGLEATNNATEGKYNGFLMGGDTAVWNTTNYTIQAGDIITLKVDGRNSWQATLLHLELYYVDGLGKRVALEYSDKTLTNNYTEFSISFAANTTPACVGNKLGVLLDNVSRSDSWLNMDNVRINANHAVVPEAGFEASVKSINFGTVNTDVTKKDSVVVTNHGTISLSITAVASTNSMFTVTPTTATVAAEGSQKFYITFAPTASGTQNGKIVFTHNAPTHDTITVTGYGNSVYVSDFNANPQKITVLNPSFERPDSGKITGFDGKSLRPGVKLLDIPDWNVDSKDSLQWDSGIEAATDFSGKYRAFLMGGDPGIYQILSRRVYADDILKLTVDAKNSWNATSLKMELFYLDNDTIAKANRVTIVSGIKTMTSAVTAFSIAINASAVPLAVGHKIGILIDNVTADSASWLQFDNVRLTNEDLTSIEVPNYSFEQPDSGKIKGWNGPGSGIGWTGNKTDVPGWTTDTMKVTDSGLEATNNATEGKYNGFLMGSDTAVWNTTNYTIQAGDIITLKVDGRNSWQATLLRLELYYIDGLGKRVALEYSDKTLTNNYTEFSISFAANTTPACVGNKLGVLLDNVSPLGNSWLNMDNVRINANHSVTSISGTYMQPNTFSLKQNYPNPFNPSTNISYTLKNSGKVRLTVFDLLGREVAVLANEIQAAGLHEVKFSANGLSSGIYFYTLQAANEVITKKMMLLK